MAIASTKTVMTVSIRKETAAWLRDKGGSRGVGEVLNMLIQKERLEDARKAKAQD